jgi:hypothetical protein
MSPPDHGRPPPGRTTTSCSCVPLLAVLGLGLARVNETTRENRAARADQGPHSSSLGRDAATCALRPAADTRGVVALHRHYVLRKLCPMRRFDVELLAGTTLVVGTSRFTTELCCSSVVIAKVNRPRPSPLGAWRGAKERTVKMPTRSPNFRALYTDALAAVKQPGSDRNRNRTQVPALSSRTRWIRTRGSSAFLENPLDPNPRFQRFFPGSGTGGTAGRLISTPRRFYLRDRHVWHPCTADQGTAGALLSRTERAELKRAPRFCVLWSFLYAT